MSSFVYLSQGLYTLYEEKADLPAGQVKFWPLSKKLHVPFLQNFSLCVDLWHRTNTSRWIAFTYQNPDAKNNRQNEIGLAGKGGQLIIWLFGETLEVAKDLGLNIWHRVCIRWSNQDGQLWVFVNGTVVLNKTLNKANLAPEGSLTLGVNHRIMNGNTEDMTNRNFVGYLYYFQMWNKEWTSVSGTECYEGSIIRWNREHGLINGSSERKQPSPRCGNNIYKIEMTAKVTNSDGTAISTSDSENLIRTWLKIIAVCYIELCNISVTNRYNCIVFVQVTSQHVESTLQDQKNALENCMYSSGSLSVIAEQGSIKIHRLSTGQQISSISIISSTSPSLTFTTRESADGYETTIPTMSTIPTTDPDLQGNCLYDVTNSVYWGSYIWPKTPAESTANQSCAKNTTMNAFRRCKISNKTFRAHWQDPELGQCPMIKELPKTIPGLEDIDVNGNNAWVLAELIKNLTTNMTSITEEDLNIVLLKVTEVVEVGALTPPLGQVIIDIISNVLKASDNLWDTASRILKITDAVGNKMFFTGHSVNLTSDLLALSTLNINFSSFMGITFGVSSLSHSFGPEIFISQIPIDDAVAFISLPSTLNNHLNWQILEAASRLQFQFFANVSLFQDPEMANSQLSTYVVSASVTNATVDNLRDPVIISLKHLSPNLDLSRSPIDERDDRILTMITYIGCGLSSIFLGVTLVTYIAFGKLRRDYPSKILMNLSTALLLLNLAFLVNSWFSSFGSYGLCIAIAVFMHYFLLASFTWMGLEAVHMYFALVKVFNVYIPSYILKFCIFGWGAPLVVVSIVLAIDKDAYGRIIYAKSVKSSNDHFCWVQNNATFYVSVVAYFMLVLVCNLGVFIVVLVQIRNMKSKKPAGTRSGFLYDLKSIVSLTFLLGLTWSFACFAWGPAKVPFLYLFSIFNSLQGFFIFLFHCLMKENVRKQWRIHLCCGRFRLEDYSGTPLLLLFKFEIFEIHILTSLYMTLI
ncbi:AGRG4 protein, partial [Polypterus senegalus]|nr:AGRG4 protein [Polypterus senegalus]